VGGWAAACGSCWFKNTPPVPAATLLEEGVPDDEEAAQVLCAVKQRMPPNAAPAPCRLPPRRRTALSLSMEARASTSACTASREEVFLATSTRALA
jgi:hypothetical protein